ncbi:MAG: YeeE/YedE family protein [Chitinophagales bacterium]
MIEFISQPWAWYISGPSLTLVMFLLLWFGGEFGASSTMRTICAIGGAGKKIPFFNFNWKSQIWNVIFVLGTVIGGYIAITFLPSAAPPQISAATINDLESLGIVCDEHLVPATIFTWQNLLTLKGFIIIVGGGFLVGFGARWAGGCTSGHAISGLSNLQMPSLIAVIGFFIGGLLMTHILFPFIFKL